MQIYFTLKIKAKLPLNIFSKILFKNLPNGYRPRPQVSKDGWIFFADDLTDA